MAEIVDFGLQQHKIKMDSRYFENVLSVVAGDTGRRIEVQLLDTNGMVQNTTGLNLRLNAVIAGKATFTDATLVDAATGKYQLDLSNGMFLAPGNWQFQWQITDSAGKKLHSFAFTGNVGSNISEGGSQATNFYLNLDDLKEMQDDLINGTFNSEALETNIAEKLEALEQTYAPRLTEVTAQLAQTAKYFSAKAYSGINGGIKIQKALDDLSNNASHRVIVVDADGPDENGSWDIREQLKIPSNTTLLLNGAVLRLGYQVNYAIMTNSDYANGNENIFVIGSGSILDCNGPGQDGSLNNYRNIGVHFYNVKNLNIRGITIKDSKRWSLVPEKCTNVLIDDIRFDTAQEVNQDGVHIMGPSSDIIVTKIRGKVGDDVCVVNARTRASGGTNVFQGYGEGGSIERVVFDDVIIDGHATGLLRTSGSPETYVSDILINNAIGYNLRDGALRLGGNDDIAQENHRNITASNIVGYGTAEVGIALVNLLQPITNLQISNAKIYGTNKYLISTNSNGINGLQMNNIYRELWGETNSSGLFDFGGSTHENIQISNLTLKRRDSLTASEGSFITTGSTAVLKNATFRDIKATSVSKFFYSETQTILENVRLDNVKIKNGTESDWGVTRSQNKEVIINGFAQEDGVGDRPNRPNYQIGDVVAYREGTIGASAYYLKTHAGTWIQISTV